VKRSIILIALISLFLAVNAQKQANYWYFGQYAGISFALGPPTPLTNGALNTGEGCSSISTAAGSLEFYTDGRFVYNKNHQQMPNGFGLNGNSSSTQSGIIVPKPGSGTEYYIFTVDAADNGLVNGLCYTKVDMTLNNGLGDVVTSEKNISLVPLACEKVTAVGNADGNTFWVITKKWGNADFYAYRITYDGILDVPVISTTGPPLVGNIGQASKGYLKVSPDGSKIASANNTDYSVGIYNFDNSTGIITHLVSDETYTSPGGTDPGGPYGVEFSPNSSRLYISEWKGHRKIHQYDLSAGDPAAILASRQVVGSVGQGSDPIGALQLGPDNRMYIARYGDDHLSRINTPNAIGAACDFVENAVHLGGRECRYGLPPFIQSFFYLSADFYWDEPACTGYETQFFTSASEDPDSVKWTFPGNITTTELNPTHHFTNPGLYGVQLQVFIYGTSKNVSHFVRVGVTPEFAIGNDTTICKSEAFYVDAGNWNSYFWQDTTTAQTNYADTTGWYWCRITNESGCPDTDSLFITVNPNPDISAGPPVTIVEGFTTTLQGTATGGSGNYSYHWEPAEFLVNPDILQPTTVPMSYTTTFTLTVTDLVTGCTSESDVLVTVEGGPLSGIALANPLVICRGEQSQLQANAYGGTGAFTYSWSSSPAGFNSYLPNPVVSPNQTTTYNVTIDDGETTVTANITVTVNQLPLPDAGANQVVIHGTPTTLSGSASQGSGSYLYHWEPADLLISANVQNPTTVNLYESTLFYLTVTDIGTGCESDEHDIVSITIGGDALLAQPSAEPNRVCSGQPVSLYPLASGGTQNYTFSWTSNPPGFTSTSEEPNVSPVVTTTYFVSVNDGYNTTTGQVSVTVDPLPQISLLPLNDPKIEIISPTEIGVCVFDSVMLDAGNPGSSYLWSNGSLEQAIKIQTSGISYDMQEFDVTVTNQATGCINNAEVIAYFTFTNCSYGIEENGIDNRLQVYPNPSSDGLLNISINGISGEAVLDVYTSQGRVAYTERVTLHSGSVYKSSLNFQDLKSGIYYLKLTCNETVIMRKLIIQKY
jgi:hypothetical protein